MKCIAWVVILLSASAVLADAPGGHGGADHPNFGRGPDARRSEAWEFFRKYSQRRAEAIGALPQEKQERMRRLITVRYGGIGLIEKENPKLFDLKVKEVQAEDKIFALKGELADSPEKGDQIRADLRKKVEELVELRMEERKQRIERLKGQLEFEEKQLKDDQTKKEKMVEKQYEKVLDAPTLETMPDRPGGARGGRPGKDKEEK
jgi:hypothetical protein